ncbi:DUF4376 domain-containing protein [Neisseria bacilliformis]|uniref:DUF4376 domain-containing protein n=1 Tax=Neisseria bacilliformis TaxID=267212 RepID=UPI002065262E|nr:MAG TPA: protein of unknown function (DUF4376) [Caudoviricetes sp.]
MTYYARDTGHGLEIIDGDWLHLYLSPEKAAEPLQHGLIKLSEALHRQLIDHQDDHPYIERGEVVFNPRPSAAHEWDEANRQWRLDAARAARLKAEQQAAVWERIKAKRADNLRHGVYVKSAGKWFHTDDNSRTQYIALAVMPRLPEKLPWKTMDNSFVNMTKALLGELMEQMLVDEQADFANAERHKAAMLKAENPLEYDYSGGWTANYEQPAAELEEAEK